jgi:glycerol-3-phosphate dehydrogenase (NAD(P)+)
MAAITIVGGGGWGTALSVLLAQRGHAITLWVRHPHNADLLRRDRINERYLPGVPLPSELKLPRPFENYRRQIS